MLINAENEHLQKSLKLTSSEDGSEESYQIFWKETWYFGSTLRLHMSEILESEFIARIEFNDNDGLVETLISTCARERFPEHSRPAISK